MSNHNPVDGGGGGGGGGGDDDNGGNNGGGGDGGGIIPWDRIAAPDWITSKPSWWGTATEWLSNPAKKVRNVVFGMILGAISWFVEPIFDAVELLIAGSAPNSFGAPGETWGIADLPVVIAELAGETLGSIASLVLGTAGDLIIALTQPIPGPIDGIIVVGAVMVVVYLLTEYGPTVLIALVELVPWIGPPLATLLRGGD